MPTFRYTAKNKTAKTVSGREEAFSKNELAARLQSQGLFVISIHEAEKKKELDASRQLALSVKGKRKSLKLYDFIFLARNLSTMLSSGVTLLRSLKLVSQQTESLKLAKTLEKCLQDVQGGLSFEEAVRKYPKIFSNLWCGIIQVGEASGNLPQVLNRLADFLEMRAEFEGKIKGALVYPCILLVAATVAVGVFVKFIFPTFHDMFAQFDLELPALTRAVLGLAGFLERNFFLLSGLIAIIVFTFLFAKKQPFFKNLLDSYTLKLPLLGQAVFLACAERFTSILHILLESGLPLVYSLNIASNNVGNKLMERQLAGVALKVKDGSSLSDELSRIQVFPPLVSEMAKVGEETGNMPDIFKKISAHYRKELVNKIDRVVASFEPLMVVFMGLVIGSIVIALFLPIFRMTAI